MMDLKSVAGTASYMVIANIAIYLLCIALAWWALQEFRFDVLLKRPQSAPAKLLQILLAIAIGHLVASFFIQYLSLSISLNQLF
jgi:uncharacterized integral membrane protein (TIGR02327 family)